MFIINYLLAAGWAVVSLSANYMREKPDYTSGLETQALMGTVVEVLDRESYWVRIKSPDGYTAWATDLGLTFMSEEEKDAYLASPKWICTACYSRIYEKPSEGSQPLSDLVMGDVLRKGEGRIPGWVEAVTPSGARAWVKAADVEDLSGWTSSRDGSAGSIIALARTFLGVPYLWGGTSVKGFDCSGLVQFVYMMNGIQLPRNTGPQSRTGEPVRPELSEMLPGDLVFYGNGKPSHVAIYMGDGKIIHCSHMVRINSLRKGEEGYYARDILAVRRVINGKNSLYLPR